MRKKLILAGSLLILLVGLLQAQQGFFLNSWKPKIIVQPDYTDTVPIAEPANVSITVHCTDTLTKIPIYMFGDNANVYTTSMSENKTLMKYLSDRKMGYFAGLPEVSRMYISGTGAHTRYQRMYPIHSCQGAPAKTGNGTENSRIPGLQAGQWT